MNYGDDFILPGKMGFKGSDFDQLLANGYYRMQHVIFTAHFTHIDISKAPLPVFWLRTPVNKIKENSKVTAIRKKCEGFKILYKKAAVTEAINELYEIYRKHITFEASENVSGYLHDAYLADPFDSWMIEIYDAENLIAVGYFDTGKYALAGILNFYHPAYKKYSLGKYLMLQKINFALADDMHYYYTGYISTAITKFDYKIFPDANAIEVFLPNEKLWVPYHLLGKEGLKAYVENNMSAT